MADRMWPPLRMGEAKEPAADSATVASIRNPLIECHDDCPPRRHAQVQLNEPNLIGESGRRAKRIQSNNLLDQRFLASMLPTQAMNAFL